MSQIDRRAAGALRSHNSRNLAGRDRIFPLGAILANSPSIIHHSGVYLAPTQRVHTSRSTFGSSCTKGLFARQVGQGAGRLSFHGWQNAFRLSRPCRAQRVQIASATNRILSMRTCTSIRMYVWVCVCVHVCADAPCTVTGLQSHTVVVARLHTARPQNVNDS